MDIQMKKKKPLHLEFHILQSFPVGCLNRDDVGSPKSAMIGGVPRARVSSQSWKRAVRTELEGLGVKLGRRTKKLEELLKDGCIKEGASDTDAEACAKVVSKELADDTLIFIGLEEIEEMVKFLKSLDFKVEVSEEGEQADKSVKNKKDQKKDKKAKELVQKMLKNVKRNTMGLNGLDIVLFGRMVAKAQEMEVEAASCFSHAISTHKSSNELDFFTALDDIQGDGEQGSSHMGATEFNSATYYRYISLDLNKVTEEFGDEAPLAVEAFTKALFKAIPEARQHVQSASCPWNFARVLIRGGQRLQASFETPVRAQSQGGYLTPSKVALKEYLDGQEKLWGSLFEKKASFEYDDANSAYSIDDLLSDIKTAL